MIHLSAFADEISPDLEEQIAVLREEGIGHVELRSVWNINVLDLSAEQVETIKQAFAANGIRVSAIGSPIGKSPIELPRAEHLRRFDLALARAHEFGTPFIRVFSFYSPDREVRGDPAAYRDDAVDLLRLLADRAGQADVTLLHENEKDIYGDTVDRCIDLLQSVGSPHFQAIFDPANFIQCAQTPYPDAYEAMRPWLRYVHVKDALWDGAITVAGEGAARWPELLSRLHTDGFEGFFSLEPHLAAAGRHSGFSGPDLFRHACRSFRALLDNLEWQYA